MKSYYLLQNQRIKIKKSKRNKNILNIRNAGIDLMRIIGMYDIVLFHILIDSNIYYKYRQYKNQLKYLEVFTNWHISNFGIISGIVNFRNNRSLKYANIIYLWLLVTFYSLSIHFYYNKKYRPRISSSYKIKYFFPVVFNNHWYFSSYFGMYLFLPIINRGILYLTKKEFEFIVFSIIFIIILWKDYNIKNSTDNNDPFNMNSGRSMIGLIVFYIIGAYIGKYVIEGNKNKKIYYYLICIFIFVFSGYLCNYYLNHNGKNNFEILLRNLFGFRLNSVAMVSQTISLNLLFSQIKYNKYISKMISFFGKLAFGVYIIHDHIDIRYIIFKDLFKNYAYNLKIKFVLLLVFQKALKYFSFCILIEFLRLLIFNLFRVKKLCMYIDKLINIHFT